MLEMVARGRLELPCSFERQILSLVCLPISPSGHVKNLLTELIFLVNSVYNDRKRMEPKSSYDSSVERNSEQSAKESGPRPNVESPTGGKNCSTTDQQRPRRASALLERVRELLDKRPLDNPPVDIPGVTATTVRLSNGGHALISIEDLDLVSGYNWRKHRCKDGQIYARAHIPGSGKRGKSITMHRLITGADLGQRIDHADGDGLHNWRENLRPATNAENVANQKPHRDKKTAKLKGVYRLKNGLYRAQIMKNYRKFNLGAFATEEQAAYAYDEAARRLFAEFSRCNFAKPTAETSAA